MYTRSHSITLAGSPSLAYDALFTSRTEYGHGHSERDVQGNDSRMTGGLKGSSGEAKETTRLDRGGREKG
jgi:hypothetical protein